MIRTFATLASLLALLAVAAGAFGAHALRARLSPEMLGVWEAAARYQMYHALGLLGVALVLDRWPGTAAVAAGWGFMVGIALFSGSLYLLAISDVRWLGAITPLGGLGFLTGWALLTIHLWRHIH